MSALLTNEANRISCSVSVDDFTEQKECKYKEEQYAVRDNGAIYRYQVEGKRKRPNDSVWTFGIPDIKTGYAKFCGESVHRIVATAFLGEPPSKDYVVDHYDTNRQNNRPENLRWVTKLENALSNPYTRDKIIFICGSIESFLKNPSQLNGKEYVDKNFSWMRALTKEEAQNMLERLECLRTKPYKERTNGIQDWIFTKPSYFIPRKDHPSSSHDWIDKIPESDKNNYSVDDRPKTELTWDSIREDLTKPYSEEPKQFSSMESVEKHNYRDSLTENALQDYSDFRTPTKFPLCPKTGSSLEEYMKNLSKGAIYSENQYANAIIKDYALVENDNFSFILIACHFAGQQIKRYCLNKVYIHDGKFAHESRGTFFHSDGLEKNFVVEQGKEWTGGDVFDDYC